METLVEYCKNYILENIGNYENESVYGADLAFTITEGPNVDGSLTYSRYEAKKYLNEWYDDCSDYWEWEKSNFGENFNNPFENPEAFMVCMVINGVDIILSRCPIVEENWNDEFELDEEAIKSIREYVENFEDESIFN